MGKRKEVTSRWWKSDRRGESREARHLGYFVDSQRELHVQCFRTGVVEDTDRVRRMMMTDLIHLHRGR